MLFDRSSVFCPLYSEWWREVDSNHRRRKPADLQSAPVGRLGIPPEMLFNCGVACCRSLPSRNKRRLRVAEGGGCGLGPTKTGYFREERALCQHLRVICDCHSQVVPPPPPNSWPNGCLGGDRLHAGDCLACPWPACKPTPPQPMPPIPPRHQVGRKPPAFPWPWRCPPDGSRTRPDVGLPRCAAPRPAPVSVCPQVNPAPRT